MLSWEHIQEIYMAVAQGKKPPLQWQQCLDGLLETLKTANNSPGLHEEERPLMKPCRDQILVALTTLLKWLEDCPVDCTTTIPVVDLAHILVSFLLNYQDKFVRNLATRCLCNCFTSEQKGALCGNWHIEVLSPCIKSLRTGENICCILDLFRLLFSKKVLTSTTSTASLVGANQGDSNNKDREHLEKIRLWSLNELTRLWRPLVDDVFSRPASGECESGEEPNPALFSLLSLWIKLIKNQQNLVSTDLLPTDQKTYAPLQTMTGRLLHAMTFQALSPSVFDKMADVLNRTLLYGCGADQFQYSTGQAYGLSADLAADLLRSVQMGLLDKVPQNTGFEGFGGGRVLQMKPSESYSSMMSDLSASEDDRGARSALQERPSLRSVRKVSLLILKACAVIMKSASTTGISTGAVEIVLSTLWTWAKGLLPPESSQHWVITVYGDQDDALVEAVLCILDVYLAASPGQPDAQTWSVASLDGIDPHELFLHFLDHFAFDHSVLLDLLTSPETCFLLYFVRYTHHVLCTWPHLCQVCLTWQPVSSLDFCTPKPQYDTNTSLKYNQDSESTCLPDTDATPRPQTVQENIVPSVDTYTCNDAPMPCSSQDLQMHGNEQEEANATEKPIFKTPTPKSAESCIMAKSPETAISDEKVNETNIIRSDQKIQSPDSGTFDNSADGSEGKTDDTQCTSSRDNYQLSPGDQECVDQSAMRLVAYSDDSSDDEVTDSDDGDELVSANSASSLEAGLNAVDIGDSSTDKTGDSAASDLGMSLTTSVTSLTSVTSDLEMPSDLLDVGMETEVEDGILDQMMSVMIRLRLVIERLDNKGLFPYNAAALRRLLCQVETLYEGEDQPN